MLDHNVHYPSSLYQMNRQVCMHHPNMLNLMDILCSQCMVDQGLEHRQLWLLGLVRNHCDMNNLLVDWTLCMLHLDHKENHCMDSHIGCLDMIHWHYNHHQNDIHRCTCCAGRCDRGNSHYPHDKSLKWNTKQMLSNQIKLFTVMLVGSTLSIVTRLWAE